MSGPFGVLVYDLESAAYNTVQNATQQTREWTDEGASASDAVRALKRFARRQADRAEQANEQRMEFIDAVIFSEDRRSADVDELAQAMRFHVRDNAPLGKGGDIERGRIAGPILVKPIQECAFPAPECRLDYSFIQISFHDDEEMYP